MQRLLFSINFEPTEWKKTSIGFRILLKIKVDILQYFERRKNLKKLQRPYSGNLKLKVGVTNWNWKT